jgi:tryptophan synthase alpha chain
MNRLIDLLQTKKENILSIYFTAGYPHLNDTTEIISGLQEAGVDLAEVGFPFSDPLADGTVIQHSSHIALESGMNLDILFSQLVDIKETIHIPLVLMGYFNPAYKYGMEKFCCRCSEAGIAGLIIPDLPFEKYVKDYKYLYDSYDLCYIPLITPQTSDERIVSLGAAAKGFIYMVSSSTITGGNTVFNDHESYFSHVRELLPGKPVLIGFGIHDAETFSAACRNANGGIIGTAFIKSLEKPTKSIKKHIGQFADSIKSKDTLLTNYRV